MNGFNDVEEYNKYQKTRLIIDPSISGISGDMFVAALIDLFEIKGRKRLTALEQAITKIDDQFQLTIGKTTRGGFAATQISINCGKITQLQHPPYLLSTTSKVLTELNASVEIISLAKRALNILLEAEARVHGENVENIHLHETGSVDTIFDTCAVALLLDSISYKSEIEIYSLPISVGGGFVETAHGRLPVPSPAATQIANQYQFLLKGRPINFELMTPTGAALLAAIQPQFIKHFPLFQITGIGIGGGQKDIQDHANILRILYGAETKKWTTEELVLLETNVDDVTGEVLGYLVEKLMAMGAMDVSILPAVMKKNRPGHLIKVICKESNINTLMTEIIHETGTLGIRINRCQRIAVHRVKKPFQTMINSEKVDITAKIAWMGDEIVSIKTEFSEIKDIAEKTGLPVKYLQKKIDGELYAKLGRKISNDD